MRLVALSALFVLFPMAAGASQKPTAQQPAQSAVEHQAKAYADFMLGHINQQQYRETGKQKYADQALQYYKKALALEPDSVEIQLEIANTYLLSQQISDAVQTVKAILKDHPDSVDAHRLLAQIYIGSLQEGSTDAEQQHLLALAVEQYEAIRKLDPKDVRSGLNLARLYRFQNKPEKAAGLLDQILKKDPSNQEALAQYTQLLLDEGHAKEAVARLSKAAKESASGHLYSLLGQAYRQLNEDALAEQAFRQAVELEPNVPSHWKRLAQTLYKDGKFEQAAKAYEHLAQFDPTNPNNFLRLAEIRFQQKKYAEAEANIKQAEQLSPGNLEIIYNVALIAQAQGRYKDAIGVIEDAIHGLQQQESSNESGTQSGTAMNPRVYSILYQELGTLYRQAGEYPSAVKTFEKMMALGPSEKQRGRLELIETYRQSRQLDQAISIAQEAIQADPKDRQLKVAFALLLGENKQTDEAVKTLRALLDGSPSDRGIYLDIAQVEQRGRRYDDAEKTARTAESMAKQPKQKVEAWLMLGVIYQQQKKYGPAEKAFRKALAVEPNNAEALNDYGYMLAVRGVRLGEAEKMVKQALAGNADNSAYLDTLGWTYYKQNRLKDAREYLLKAVSHSPHDPTILGHLGDVYDRLGETKLAIETWEKALTEWKRSIPADYEPDQVREIERKITRAKAKNRSASKDPAESLQPR